MDLVKIKEIVQAEMGDKRSHPFKERGNKYAHGQRVAKLALRLRALLWPEENDWDEVLTVAAWFHDIRNGMDNHAILGAQRTQALLAEHCKAEELQKICDIIAVHDDRKPRDEPYSDIVKIHQDADHLDHFGTYDIWMLVHYTTGHNETIDQALHYLKHNWPEDNARWRGELHFDLSIRIFDDKTEFFKTYIKRFETESAGEIWNEHAFV